MLSVTIAKKLKEAGFTLPTGRKAMHQSVTDGNIIGIVIGLNFGNGDRKVQWVENIGDADWRLHEKWVKFKDLIWLPSLSDLMEWLEEKGVHPVLRTWDYHDDGTNIYECQLEWENPREVVFSEEMIAQEDEEYTDESHPVLALSKEDAVAKAVLWMLQKHK
jgi:hypothetical protein